MADVGSAVTSHNQLVSKRIVGVDGGRMGSWLLDVLQVSSASSSGVERIEDLLLLGRNGLLGEVNVRR